MNTKRFITLGFFALLISVVSFGCRKKEDTIAEITVRNASNQVVAGAKVTLKGESTTNNTTQNVVLSKTSTTNSAGVATFDFNDTYQLGQAGVAVLNIEAEQGGLTGEGIIKIEEETTNTETVYIQ